jgi:hypothetical protein
MEHHVKGFEHEALIRGLGLQADAATTQGLRGALAQVTDWEYLLKTALDHGVFPCLYRRVADFCPEAAPPDFLNQLRNLYKAHARRNLKLTTELIRVLNLLASHGITAVAYKGPVLAAVAYGDIALRQFVDLDILVSRQDSERVRDLLTSKGYRLYHCFTKKQGRVHLTRSTDFTFSHPQHTRLDVHWRFAADYLGGGPDADAALERRVTRKLEGKTVYCLGPEDMLLTLCLHGTSHFWSQLSMVNDVAHLIGARAAWDWQGLLQRSGEFGMRRQVLLGLSLARELLAAPVPPEVLQQADADPGVVGLRRQVRKNLFARSETDLGLVEQTSFYLQTRDCFRDKLAHVWSRMAIPTVEDWRWVPLPDACYWLYYALRPLRLGLEGLVLPLIRRLTDGLTKESSRTF